MGLNAFGILWYVQTHGGFWSGHVGNGGEGPVGSLERRCHNHIHTKEECRNAGEGFTMFKHHILHCIV